MAQVQIIQPYQPQSDALEKVAAYCRVSTDCPLPAKIDRKKVKKTE